MRISERSTSEGTNEGTNVMGPLEHPGGSWKKIASVMANYFRDFASTLSMAPADLASG